MAERTLFSVVFIYDFIVILLYFTILFVIAIPNIVLQIKAILRDKIKI